MKIFGLGKVGAPVWVCLITALIAFCLAGRAKPIYIPVILPQTVERQRYAIAPNYVDGHEES
jgi:hypothetical protein